MAPSSGTDSTTSTDASAEAMASRVLDWCRSSTNHTAKYSVATFMEKIVFAKSYSAQLPRSRRVPYVLICGSINVGDTRALRGSMVLRQSQCKVIVGSPRRDLGGLLSQFCPKSSP